MIFSQFSTFHRSFLKCESTEYVCMYICMHVHMRFLCQVLVIIYSVRNFSNLKIKLNVRLWDSEIELNCKVFTVLLC